MIMEFPRNYKVHSTNVLQWELNVDTSLIGRLTVSEQVHVLQYSLKET